MIKPLLASLVLALSFAPACAVEETTDGLVETESEAGVRPSFDLWKTGSKHYFHLEAGNGEILLSSQGYTTRQGALGGILSVLDNGGLTSRYQIKLGADGQSYVNLTAANGQIIASSEGYVSRSNANRAIESMVRNVGSYLAYWDDAQGARFQVEAEAPPASTSSTSTPPTAQVGADLELLVESAASTARSRSPTTASTRPTSGSRPAPQASTTSCSRPATARSSAMSQMLAARRRPSAA
ncbi:MAG: YegP family protein [Kofleriaceae bacterium]